MMSPTFQRLTLLAKEAVGEAELALVVIVPAAVPGVQLVPSGGLWPSGAPVAPKHVADVTEEPAEHLPAIYFSVKFPLSFKNRVIQKAKIKALRKLCFFCAVISQ